MNHGKTTVPHQTWSRPTIFGCTVLGVFAKLHVLSPRIRALARRQNRRRVGPTWPNGMNPEWSTGRKAHLEDLSARKQTTIFLSLSCTAALTPATSTSPPLLTQSSSLPPFLHSCINYTKEEPGNDVEVEVESDSLLLSASNSMVESRDWLSPSYACKVPLH